MSGKYCGSIESIPHFNLALRKLGPSAEYIVPELETLSLRVHQETSTNQQVLVYLNEVFAKKNQYRCHIISIINFKLVGGFQTLGFPPRHTSLETRCLHCGTELPE